MMIRMTILYCCFILSIESVQAVVSKPTTNEEAYKSVYQTLDIEEEIRKQNELIEIVVTKIIDSNHRNKKIIKLLSKPESRATLN